MEIKKYLEAGKIGKEARELGKELIKEGASYYEVAEKIENYIRDAGAKPAFPVNLSVNHEAAHYSPVKDDGRYFRRGDVVKLDLGAQIDGYISDTAVTIEVGTNKWRDLIEASAEALNNAIKSIKPGIEVGKIGKIIEESLNFYGFNPIRNLTGHGLGRYDLHHGLVIPNYDDGSREKLLPGMAFAIEPFATNGRGYVREGKGGNIYIFRKTKDLKGLYEEMFEEFKTLPFAARWCTHYPDYKSLLKKGSFLGIIYHFPILRERKKFVVAQTEHTLLLTEDSIIVTTK
ncbi:MAG: type II methionyl aminopeptidase [Thermoplasmata archaeon]|nr:type II methionyl aminopeptidase [Thermoplasmata archaeon]